MIQVTRGIVFHTTRYSETSAVVKIYTEDFGLMSFLVKGLYAKKSKIRAAMFGHLTLLDLIVERREHKSLHYIREISINHTTPDFQVSIFRSSVVLFINELLYRCVKEEECNRPLFAFIIFSLQQLGEKEVPVQAFHLLFMLKLTRFLGFSPRLAKTDAGSYFDMEEGLFLDSEPLHRYYISGQPAAALEQLQGMEYPDLKEFTFSKPVRDELLERLIDFYRLHIPEMGEMKSVKVLQELLS
ncbi:MAG: DNA repair protein RecO [Bacteroidota bacterium]